MQYMNQKRSQKQTQKGKKLNHKTRKQEHDQKSGKHARLTKTRYVWEINTGWYFTVSMCYETAHSRIGFFLGLPWWQGPGWSGCKVWNSLQRRGLRMSYAGIQLLQLLSSGPYPSHSMTISYLYIWSSRFFWLHSRFDYTAGCLSMSRGNGGLEGGPPSPFC